MVSRRDRFAFSDLISAVMNGLSGLDLHVMVFCGACLSSSMATVLLKVVR